ncbi:MAG: class I SAM-dependent methyltransferase [Kofleriaceae bacterium]|nr:class I SAM-dependent methyltransferase [Kofleriaceae bacterium]
MPVFRDEPLREIIARITAGERVLDVVDPDLGRGRYAGEPVDVDGVRYIHRPLRVWVDLAERLGLRLLLPRPLAPPLVRLTFEPLASEARLRPTSEDPTERYGAASPFARISKLEDPGFVIDFAEALSRITFSGAPRILDLGVNTGDELALLAHIPHATLVGVDHSASAISVARARFPQAQLHVADLNALPALGLGRFDLVIAMSTLQSAGIDDRELLRRIVQDHLAPTGAVLIGMPNCRYIDGELEYGARMKNFSQPELGLLVKDVTFYRKYLQQHHRHVFVTGKHYLLVLGVVGPSM